MKTNAVVAHERVFEWYDNCTRDTWEIRLVRACEFYQKKYGKNCHPTKILVHPNQFEEIRQELHETYRDWNSEICFDNSIIPILADTSPKAREDQFRLIGT